MNWQTLSARVRPGLEKIGRQLHFDEVRIRRVWTAAGCALVLCGVLWQRCGLGGCPNVARLTSYQPNGATVLLDRTGRPFADLAPVHYKVVPLETLPAHVTDAFLAVEDKRFFAHNGVDWRRVLGAVLVNVKSGELRQGSSTITMQLTRNLFPKEVPGRERTFRRKLLEVRVARMIERKFEKKDILELYLNHIYFGNGAYGIEAASQHYYRKPARKLTAAQAALIAALPKAPSSYDPRRHAERAKERRNRVLDLMAAQGRLDSAKAKAAKATRLAISPRPRRDNQDDGLAPYFVDLVRRQLEDRFGDVLYERRLRVYTTLDVRAQRASEEELFRQLRDLEAGAYGRLNGPRYASNAVSDEQGTRYLQGAVVIMDVRSGNVLALVGGRDFIDSNFNRATQSKRQLGSAFKPFVFATAIASGVPASRQLADQPLRIQTSRTVAWEPRNYDGSFYGIMSMREALVKSRNIPTINLATSVGLGAIKRTAQQAGLAGDMVEQPAMALGTVATSPLELTRAYTVFPGLGQRPDARFVVRVEDDDGTILYQTRPHVEGNHINPRAAYVVTHMLRDAVDIGTGVAVRSVGFYQTVAGKTGTTNDNTDAWFVGYTPELVGTVWIGFDQPRSIARNANGGRLAAPVWGRIMRRVYADRSTGDFNVPAGIVERQYDPESGLLLEEGCWPRWGEPATELFLEGMEPETTCPSSGGFRWITDLFDRGEQGSSASELLEQVLGDRLRRLDGGDIRTLERFLERAMRRGGVTHDDLDAVSRTVDDWLRAQLQRDGNRRRRGERQ